MFHMILGADRLIRTTAFAVVMLIILRIYTAVAIITFSGHIAPHSEKYIGTISSSMCAHIHCQSTALLCRTTDISHWYKLLLTLYCSSEICCGVFPTIFGSRPGTSLSTFSNSP